MYPRRGHLLDLAGTGGRSGSGNIKKAGILAAAGFNWNLNEHRDPLQLRHSKQQYEHNDVLNEIDA